MEITFSVSLAKFLDENRGNKSRAAFVTSLLRDLKNNPDTLAYLQAKRQREDHAISEEGQRKA